MLDRFGSIDPSEGGDTQRQQAIATLVVRPDRSSSLTAVASVTRYALTLFNDFTFQAIDPRTETPSSRTTGARRSTPAYGTSGPIGCPPARS